MLVYQAIIITIHGERDETFQKPFNPGYTTSLRDESSRYRYAQKLGLLNGTDLYEETQ